MTPSLLTDSVTYDLERAVHYTLLWGLEGLELRAVGGLHDRVPNINEHQLTMRLTESELPVVAVDPGVFVGNVDDRAEWMNELVQLADTFAFCRRIGCTRVLASSFVGNAESDLDRAAGALAKAGREAERRGLTICVLNEIGYTAPTGSMLRRLLDSVDVQSVRAAWDPAAAVEAGEDPAVGLAELEGRIELVRCRNVERTGNGYEPRPIDNGDVHWDVQIRRLAESGFDGPISLVVDVEPVAKQGLYGATEIVRLLRSAAHEVKP